MVLSPQLGLRQMGNEWSTAQALMENLLSSFTTMAKLQSLSQLASNQHHLNPYRAQASLPYWWTSNLIGVMATTELFRSYPRRVVSQRPPSRVLMTQLLRLMILLRFYELALMENSSSSTR